MERRTREPAPRSGIEWLRSFNDAWINQIEAVRTGGDTVADERALRLCLEVASAVCAHFRLLRDAQSISHHKATELLKKPIEEMAAALLKEGGNERSAVGLLFVQQMTTRIVQLGQLEREDVASRKRGAA